MTTKTRYCDIDRKDRLWTIINSMDNLIGRSGSVTKNFITYVNEAIFGTYFKTVGSGGDFKDINEIDNWYNSIAGSGTEEDLYIFYILPETHEITSGLEFGPYPPHMALLGFSETNTVIKPQTSVVGGTTLIKKEQGNILLRGLRLYGGSSDVGFEEAGGMTDSVDFYVDHCIFDNISTGIITNITDTSPLHVTNCKFIWNESYGIYWRNNAGYTSKIADCVFLGPDPVGSSIAIRTEGNTVPKIEDIYITRYDKGLYTRNGGIANNVKCLSCTEAFYVGDQYGNNNPLLLSNCMADGCTTDIETIDGTSMVYISGGMFDASKITQFAGSVISGVFIDHTTDQVVIYPENITPFTTKVSSDDTTPGYLDGKLIGGSGITLTPGNPGGDETLEIAVNAGGINDHKVKVSSNDTDEDYLLAKLASEGTIDISEVDDGGNETVGLDINYDNTTIDINGSAELQVKDGGIDTAQLADDSVEASKIGTDVDYSVISGNDGATDVTGAELEELTDGSDTSLHTHSGLTPGAHASTHTDGTDNISTDGTTVGINGSDELYVPDGGIDTAQLASRAVEADKIAANVAGDGLAQHIVTNALSVNVDNTTLEIDSDVVQVKDDGITVDKLAHSIDATGIGFDADKVDGQDASDFAAAEHAAQHQSGGGDAIKLDDLDTPDDNTDLNATTSYHGLLPKLDNDSAHFLDGQGNWTTPPSTSDHKVKVSSNDTDEDYLLAKMASEAPIVISESNDGGNEDVSITLSVDGTTVGINGSDELYVPDGGIVAAKLGADVNYSAISGNDGATDVTGAELEELTDGSDTSLHTHSGLTPGSHAASHTDGIDNIAVGGGLEIDSNQVEIADDGVQAVHINSDVAGDGIGQSATGALKVNTDNTTLEIATDTLQVVDGGIDTAQLADAAVNREKIAADIAGDGLSQAVSGAIDVNVDDDTLETDSDTLRVKDDGITGAKLNGFAGADAGRILVKSTGNNFDYLSLSSLYDGVFIVDPEGYGDYTDIATALSAASSASPTSSSRKLVLISPGTYTITSGLTAVQYVDIIGMSRDTCRIVDGASSAISMITTASDMTIANLTLDGQYNTYNTKGVVLGGTHNNILIKNIYFNDLYSALYGSSKTVTKVIMENCWCVDNWCPVYLLSCNLTDVCVDTIKIWEESIACGYGIYSHNTSTTTPLKVNNVKILDALSLYSIVTNGNGVEMYVSNCEIIGGSTGYSVYSGSGKMWLNNCRADGCSTDVHVGSTSGRVYISGGMFDETTFSDAGRGMIGTKAITGGFFDLDGEDWSTRAP